MSTKDETIAKLVDLLAGEIETTEILGLRIENLETDLAEARNLVRGEIKANEQYELEREEDAELIGELKFALETAHTKIDFLTNELANLTEALEKAQKGVLKVGDIAKVVGGYWDVADGYHGVRVGTKVTLRKWSAEQYEGSWYTSEDQYIRPSDLAPLP